ncbi:MAG: glutamyl-tRNA reductase [Actinobacteria bacterium]|nr:glutamyl-tRNA reductase [Actinomycetota bacterium]MBV9936496.1 glutamyl-tRNA reductase [Actinomycetota bacterium]
MSVIVVGLNHRTVPLEVLERMTVNDAHLPKALHDLTSRSNLSEAVVLSTCMRTEIYAVADKYHGAVQDVRNFLSELGFTAPEEFTDHLYSFHDDAAVTHLFRVASGLDSAVLGEGEVLGQVRHAWEKAREESAAGPVLSALFRHAVEVGKRARAETAIARGTTSVSQAAVEMAARQLGSLEGRSILVLGAGDMGEGIAVALSSSASSSRVLVANRTWTKAVAVANRVGGEAIDFGSLAAALEDVDVVLTTTGSPSVLIEASDVSGVMDSRERDLLIVDIAVPRDVDPSVRNLPGVTLLDMDDLRAFAEAGIAGRRGEIAKVEAIIAEEVQRFLDASVAREAAPLVAALRERAEQVRQAELSRLAARLDGLDDRQRQAVEALTRGILNKLLHEPTVRLKDAAGSPRGESLAAALRALFDLE